MSFVRPKTQNTRLFYNIICALGFTEGGNGMQMSHFEENHYFQKLDWTLPREAGKALTLFPEFTVAGITLKLSFMEALTNPVKLFLVSERFNQIFIDATHNTSKNSLINR